MFYRIFCINRSSLLTYMSAIMHIDYFGADITNYLKENQFVQYSQRCWIICDISDIGVSFFLWNIEKSNIGIIVVAGLCLFLHNFYIALTDRSTYLLNSKCSRFKRHYILWIIYKMIEDNVDKTPQFVDDKIEILLIATRATWKKWFGRSL